MEQDSRYLHFAVKPAGSCAGQLDFGVKNTLKTVDTIAVDNGGNRSAIAAQLNRDTGPVRTLDKVNAANRSVHRYQPTIEFGANQLVEGCRHRLGQVPMTQYADAGGRYDGPEALVSRSFDQHTIANRKSSFHLRLNVDGLVAILNKERALIPAIVGDGSLKRDWKLVAGLGVAESVDRTQRCKRPLTSFLNGRREQRWCDHGERKAHHR